MMSEKTLVQDANRCLENLFDLIGEVGPYNDTTTMQAISNIQQYLNWYRFSLLSPNFDSGDVKIRTNNLIDVLDSTRKDFGL